MHALALMVATAALGVDYGWHRLPNGEWEYIIQVEPALVQTLINGQSLVSQMPPELQGVRRFRVQVGDGEIPREPLPSQPISLNTPGNVPRTTAFGGATFSPHSPAHSWPIGVDPRAMAALRTYEWVSLDPIELSPLENEFLRQWGGPDDVPLTERPWEKFSQQNSRGSSLWPPVTRNNGSQWRTDERGRTAGTSRSTFPSSGGRFGANDRAVDQFDLNEDDGQLQHAGGWSNSNSAGHASRTERAGFPSTQRGTLNEHASGSRRSANGHARTSGDESDLESERSSRWTPTRGPRGALTEEAVGANAWWPLTMTVVLLFASLGGNLYLGWLALDFYRRYREAAWQLRVGDGPAN